MMYERGLSKSTSYLEDWIIDSVLIPFTQFLELIEHQAEEIYSSEPTQVQITQVIFNIISGDIFCVMDGAVITDV